LQGRKEPVTIEKNSQQKIRMQKYLVKNDGWSAEHGQEE